MPQPAPRHPAAEFLDRLHDGETGWLSLFAVDRNTGERHVRWAELPDVDTLVTQALELEPSCCVWVGVAPRHDNYGSSRGRSDQCVTMPAAYVDIDICGPGHAADDLPPDRQAARQLIDRMPIPPTVVVDTGGGFQAYWQFDEPREIGDLSEFVERWGHTWTTWATERGWGMDNVWDFSRVLRLPGTTNRKPDTEPRPVTMVEVDWTRRYGIDDIDQWLTNPPAPEPKQRRNAIPWIGPPRPGDAFNASVDPATLLEAAGCHYDNSSDGNRHYRAPHRSKRTDTTGITIYADGHTTIYSDTFARRHGMSVKRPYDAFGLYTHLHHGGDWQQATKALSEIGYGTRDVALSELIAPTTPTPTTDETWPAPTPLGDPQLPPFPSGVFPAWIDDMVDGVADEIQTPRDLPAMLVIGLLAIICGGTVRVKVRGTWTEPTNIFVVVALPPSTGKSPAQKLMFAPIERWLSDERRRVEPEIRQAELERRMIESDKAKAEKSGDRTAAMAYLDELADKPVPKMPQLWTDDATPEAFVMRLHEHNGRMSIMSTEGGPFQLMAGRYNDQMANLDPYLKAWSGDPITVDRIGRDSYMIERPATSIVLTVQPSVLRQVGENTDNRNRGLPARFMMSIPASNVGRRNLVDAPELDDRVADEYGRRMRQLIERVRAVDTMTLTLNDSARRGFLMWRQSLEQRRAGDLEDMAEWSSKLESTVARLAGVLHVAHGHDDTTPIADETMVGVLAVAAYWIEHARAAHDLWDADSAIANARAIMDKLVANGETRTTVRDLMRSHRRRFSTVDSVVEAVQILTESGWMRSEDGALHVAAPRRGERSPSLIVHPESHTLWINTRHVAHVPHVPKGVFEHSSSSFLESTDTWTPGHEGHEGHENGSQSVPDDDKPPHTVTGPLELPY